MSPGGAARDPARPVLRQQLAPEVADVAALVAVLGELDRRHRRVGLARRLHVAGPDRQRQHLHLVAGVVDVELAGDRVAGEPQQARQRVADGGVAPVGDVHRAGRVGAQILEHDARHGRAALIRRRVTAPVVARGEDQPQRLLPEGVREAQVDESGPGDRRLGEQRLAARRASRATIASAIARGGLPAPLASARATFEEKSPCSGRLGLSIGIEAGSAGTIPSATSSETAAVTRDRADSRALNAIFTYM